MTRNRFNQSKQVILTTNYLTLAKLHQLFLEYNNSIGMKITHC